MTVPKRVVKWKCHCYSDSVMDVSQNEELNCPGVYILGICEAKKFKPLYVDYANNMKSKITSFENGNGSNTNVNNLMNINNRINVIIKFIMFGKNPKHELESGINFGEMILVKEYFILTLKNKLYELYNKKPLVGPKTDLGIEIDYSCCTSKQ